MTRSFTISVKDLWFQLLKGKKVFCTSWWRIYIYIFIFMYNSDCLQFLFSSDAIMSFPCLFGFGIVKYLQGFFIFLVFNFCLSLRRMAVFKFLLVQLKFSVNILFTFSSAWLFSFLCHSRSYLRLPFFLLLFSPFIYSHSTPK